MLQIYVTFRRDSYNTEVLRVFGSRDRAEKYFQRKMQKMKFDESYWYEAHKVHV
jgi:hypothetical protein